MARRSIEKGEPFVFSDTVLKGQTLTLTELIEIDCRATNLKIIIPLGPEGDLWIRPYFKTSKDTPRQFVNFVGTKQYFSGDDVVYDIPLDVPIEAYSTLYVVAENKTDAVTGFDYPLDVIISVEYQIGEKSENA